MVLETDISARSSDDDVPSWIHGAIVTLLVAYGVELTVRLFVYQFLSFRSHWNIIDFCVIVVDLVFLVCESFIGDLPNLSILRLLRLLRLARAFRVLILFPELHAMLRGLGGALKTIMWGSILLSLILVLCSIIAVQLLHPLNVNLAADGVYDDCEQCPRAFESVFQSFLSLFEQMLLSDNWGDVALPIIKAYPLTLFFFGAVLVLTSFGVMNLILAGIVEKAQEAHEADLHELANEKERQY